MKPSIIIIIISVVLYPALLPTLHFCVPSNNDNFVGIGNPLLMIGLHAFICSRKKRSNNAYYCKNTSYILLLSVFHKQQNVHMVSWRYHKKTLKNSLIKPLETQSVQYFLITFNCLSIILNYIVSGHSLIILAHNVQIL